MAEKEGAYKKEIKHIAEKIAQLGDYLSAAKIAFGIGANKEAIEYVQKLAKDPYGKEAVDVNVETEKGALEYITKQFEQDLSYTNIAQLAKSGSFKEPINEEDRKASLERADNLAKKKNYGKAGLYALYGEEPKKALDYAKKIVEKGGTREAREIVLNLFAYNKLKEGWEISKGANKTIDDVVISILAFGGIGLLFSIFSKPYAISPENVQLAPPFPNYLIYVFLAMLIGGAGYFIAKHFLRKRDIIPLSF